MKTIILIGDKRDNPSASNLIQSLIENLQSKGFSTHYLIGCDKERLDFLKQERTFFMQHRENILAKKTTLEEYLQALNKEDPTLYTEIYGSYEGDTNNRVIGFAIRRFYIFDSMGYNELTPIEIDKTAFNSEYNEKISGFLMGTYMLHKSYNDEQKYSCDVGITIQNKHRIKSIQDYEKKHDDCILIILVDYDHLENLASSLKNLNLITAYMSKLDRASDIQDTLNQIIRGVTAKTTSASEEKDDETPSSPTLIIRASSSSSVSFSDSALAEIDPRITLYSGLQYSAPEEKEYKGR